MQIIKEGALMRIKLPLKEKLFKASKKMNFLHSKIYGR
jgi:hypothetical protein